MKINSVEKNAKIINRYLKTQLRGKPPQLYEAASHLIVNGGKRLRPFLVIKSCELLGGNPTAAIAASSAIELIHNFTLVHDDIMDNDEIRHGVPTVHKKFGMPVAILAGDVLFSKAYQLVSRSRLSPNFSLEIVSKLAQACVDVCEGQLLDIRLAETKKIPTPEDYIHMINKKTAALFEVSCAMGAICAKGEKKDVLNLSTFGKNLGIAFQITDDLIGVIGDPKISKKPVGNDIREGKKSLPMLIAIKNSNSAERKIIFSSFGNSKATKKQIEAAVNLIKSQNVEEIIRKKAQSYAEKAKKSIASYSKPAKKELISLLDFVVKRSL